MQSRRALAQDGEIFLYPLGLKAEKEQCTIGQILPKLTSAGFFFWAKLGQKMNLVGCSLATHAYALSASKGNHQGRNAAAENHLQSSLGIPACSKTLLEVCLVV